MASQTQGIQQLLIAEKKAAEKVWPFYSSTFGSHLLIMLVLTLYLGPRGPQEEGSPTKAGQGWGHHGDWEVSGRTRA